MTSMLSPLLATSTSCGRMALALTRLSTAGASPTTCSSGRNSLTACMAPMTAAAPPMSLFMPTMPVTLFRL